MQEPITFNDNILVAGFLARQYSKGFTDTPVRGFGGNGPDQTLLIGNDVYNISCGRRTIDGRDVGGVAMTIKFNEYSPGEKRQESFFFTFEALSRVCLVVEGYRE